MIVPRGTLPKNYLILFKMESLTVCPLCNAKNSLKEYLSGQDYFLTNEKFIIAECSECLVLSTNPQPGSKEIGKYYQDDSYLSHSQSNKGFISKTYKFIRNIMINKKIALIRKHKKNKAISILDYGCGNGDFLYACKKNGMTALGFEPNNKARNIALKKDISVTANKNFVNIIPEKSIDVVCFWHSIEHIHDINEEVNNILEILKNDGLMVVAVPDYKSFDAGFYKKHWAAYDLPRHLYHFTEQSITNYFNNKGCKLIEKKPLAFDSFYISYLSESYKKKGKIIAFVFGIIIGGISYLKAKFGNRPFSSQIYVFKKTK